MAYRRKLTALFISAAFVLTLALSFFLLRKNCLMTTATAAIPAQSAKRSICASGRFPSVHLSRSRRTMENPFPSPIFFRRSFPFRRFSSHGFLHAGHPPCQAHRLKPALAFLFPLY